MNVPSDVTQYSSSYYMQDLGAFQVADGVKFRVWAHLANDVKLIRYDRNGAEVPHQMCNEQNGYWSIVVADAKDGEQYLYRIDGRDKSDPRAKSVVHSADNSIVQLDNYQWKVNDFKMAPWNELVIYQMHCATYPDKTPQKKGLIRDIIDELWYLQKLGVNAIQLLPTAEFATDVSFGYNTAVLYAVESSYGGPTALKELVDAAHARGIAVFLDVVYNHLSPDGEKSIWQLTEFHPKFWVKDEGDGEGGGIYFYNDYRAYTPWGKRNRPDYGRQEVRDYLRDNVMMWLLEYRIDGLRFDSVVNIRNVYGNNNDPGNDLGDGWRLLQDINNSISYEQQQRQRNIITIAEDLQNNEWITKDTGAGGAGFGAQWDAFFLHSSRDVLRKTWDEERDMFRVRDILYSRYGTDAFRRVIPNETHDEAATKNGKSRLTDAIDPGQVDTSWVVKKRIGLGAALVMTGPGIPSVLQGQEVLEWRPFGDERDVNGVDWKRFCNTDDDCKTCMTKHRKCLTPGGQPCDRTIPCSDCPGLIERCEPEGAFKGIYLLYRDLIRLRRNWYNDTRGLRGQHINVFHTNNTDKLVAYHRWEYGGPGCDVVVVLNFGNRSYNNYTIGFPAAGHWEVRFNSDSNAYDPSFGNFFSYGTDASPGQMDGMDYQGNVGIGPYSAIILTQ